MGNCHAHSVRSTRNKYVIWFLLIMAHQTPSHHQYQRGGIRGNKARSLRVHERHDHAKAYTFPGLTWAASKESLGYSESLGSERR